MATLFSVGQAFINLVILLLVRFAFDKTAYTGNFYTLAFVGIAIILLYILNAAVLLWTRHVVIKATKAAIQQFRDEILKKFYAFPRYFNSAVDRSKLHAIVVQDTERLDNMSNAVFAQIMPALMVCIAISAVLIYFNWFLFLLTVLFVPFLLLTGKIVGRTVRRHIRVFHRSFGSFSKGMLFALQMMDLTKIQSAEQHEIARQKKYIEKLRHSSHHMTWAINIYTVIQSTLVACSGAVVLVVGGIMVAMNKISLGVFLSFYTAVALLRNQLQTIFTAIPIMSEGKQSLERLYSWFEVQEPALYSGKKAIEFRGKISLKEVSFQYSGNGQPLFEGVSLEILPGEALAITGPSGAGKSTIANLILGFYRPQKGELFADGHSFTEIDIAQMRRFIRIVRQDAIIFPGTIYENITYGSPEASRAEVIEAAETATANEFIQKFPRGYDTYVGENGMLLSGGQRQRIAIARALLGKPRFLILDEPTNHLERSVINRLMDNLSKLDHSMVKLIISHDAEVLGQIEKLFVLKDGRLLPKAGSGSLIQDNKQRNLQNAANEKSEFCDR